MATSSRKTKPATSASTRKSTAKTGTKKAPKAAKPEPVEEPAVEPAPESLAEIPVPKVVTVSEPVVAEPDLKKRELIDLVVERSDIRKKFAKPVVEAMLAVLGEAIAEGRELNLQPLGKLRINRAEEKSNGRVVVCKIRQSLASHGGAAAAEDDAEDDMDTALRADAEDGAASSAAAE